MKFAASLLLLTLAVSALAGCDTSVTRRELYNPKQASGYWSDRYDDQYKHAGVFGVSNSEPRH